MLIIILTTFIKYCAIILCSYYVYIKLLSFKPIKEIHFAFILLTILALPVIYLLREYAAPLSIIIMTLLFTFFAKYALGTSLNLSLSVSTISFGISYSAFLLSAVLMSLVGYLINILFNSSLTIIVTMFCTGMLQFLLSIIPFRFKRLRKGMPFLYEYGNSDTGVYISVSLLLAVSFMNTYKDADLLLVIPVFFCLLCGLTLFFWWRNSITKNYMKKVKNKEIEELNIIIQENYKELEQLKYHNQELSKIIHKDNKLIPAMEFAVREFLLAAENDTKDELRPNKAKELLKQLESMSQERVGILNHYETKSKVLTSTNVPTVDTLLSYMLQKANQYRINLDLSLSGSVPYFVDHIIGESDIRTLLADLIDNAIIATKNSEKKNIMIHIGISDGHYTIDIFDSGESFTPETLLSLGKKQTTTHSEEGGSGIGLMTTFDIIRKTRASFVIDDLSDHNLFSKKVSVCFDSLGQYRLKTGREDVIKILAGRNDLLINHDIDHIQEAFLTFSTQTSV